MCGRFSLHGDERELQARFFVDFMERRLPPLMPRFNIAPSQFILAIVENRGTREPRMMRWGFRPGWMREPKGPPPINAMAETLTDKPMWRSALRHGRCLIPASGFYEWRSTPGSRTKQPMHIRVKGADFFAFAGLFSDSEEFGPTCAIITTVPNEVMASIHNRMPAILTPQDEAIWLEDSSHVPLEVLAPYDDDATEAFAVSDRVGNVRNDDPELIQPLLLP